MPIDWSGAKEASVGSDIEITGPQNFGHRYWQGLSFSFCVFTKVGYGGVYVVNKYKYVVLVEWVIGGGVMILLLINLSNTVPILHRLVTAIF